MKPRTRTVLIVVAVLVVCVAVTAWAAYRWAKGLEADAYAGRDQGIAAAHSLAAGDVAQASSRFRAASSALHAAAALLDEGWVPIAAGVSPYWHRQYDAARALVTVGRDGADAGVEITAAFLLPTVSSTGETETRIAAALTAGRPHVDRALALAKHAAAAAASLPTSGLDPRLASAAVRIRSALAQSGPFLDRADAAVALASYLMSSDRRILVISQDSAELRPTGGFAGSYGLVDVGPQGATLEKYADVYTLPIPKKLVKPPAGAIMSRGFTFRDANWWVDFPTSARAMLGFWTTYRQPRVDGIVAIDLVTVKDLLGALGPVRVAGYAEPFTADDLIARLLYLIEVKKQGQTDRKNVLVALAHVLEDRITSSGQSEIASAALAMSASADAKHTQLYFSDPAAEAAVTGLGWSGSIAEPPAATDLLAVVNAVVVPAKTNMVTSKTVDYSVGLQPDGSADTTLVLGFANHAPAIFSASVSVFGDYVRVHRAPGTTLTPGPGSVTGSVVASDIGLPTLADFFRLRAGKRRTETWRTVVPAAWRRGAAPAPGAQATAGRPASAGVAHYRLFLVRQADLEDVPTTVQVTAPPGWRVTSVSAWSVASHATFPAVIEAGVARLSLPLPGDTVLDVGLESVS